MVASDTQPVQLCAVSALLRPPRRAASGWVALGGGAVHAEALAFALARHIPLSEAQALVKAAAQESGGTLIERVAERARAANVPAPELDDLGIAALARMWVERALEDQSDG